MEEVSSELYRVTFKWANGEEEEEITLHADNAAQAKELAMRMHGDDDPTITEVTVRRAADDDGSARASEGDGEAAIPFSTSPGLPRSCHEPIDHHPDRDRPQTETAPATAPGADRAHRLFTVEEDFGRDQAMGTAVGRAD